MLPGALAATQAMVTRKLTGTLRARLMRQASSRPDGKESRAAGTDFNFIAGARRIGIAIVGIAGMNLSANKTK